jgi:hypothetical protein
LLLPEHLIQPIPWRYAAVLAMPVLIGWGMSRIGRSRAGRGSRDHGLAHFLSGWGFAFALGAVRLLFAK